MRTEGPANATRRDQSMMTTLQRPTYPRLLPLGDAALTFEFGDRIDSGVHAKVMGLAELIAAARRLCSEPLLAAVVDVVPSFRSLTVHFDPLAVDAAEIGQCLTRLAAASAPVVYEGRHWRLPVCFEGDLAPDLDRVAAACGLGRDEVVALMSSTAFRVYMIGFMPGFPYMGGLPAVLNVPRLASPRKRVPARALAIAGEMCAVYPWESPGGWNLIGRLPLPLFAARAEPPALLAAGDVVEWQVIDHATYQELEQALGTGDFDASRFLVSGETS